MTKDKIIPRDWNKVAIIKGEVRGYTTSITSKKVYSRKIKHKVEY